MIEVNAMGEACAIPVVKTPHALQRLNSAGTVQTLVNNEIAVQNLTRLAESKGCCTHRNRKAFGKRVLRDHHDRRRLRRQRTRRFPAPFRRRKKTVVVVSADHMGEGSARSWAAFSSRALFALTQQEHLPSTVLFYNGGAKLTTEGSAFA